MQDSCITEIHRNKTVRESLEPSRLHVTTTSSNNKQTDSAMTTPFDSGRHDSDLSMTEIIESIEEIACPNECFDRGTCQKGTLERKYIVLTNINTSCFNGYFKPSIYFICSV